MKLRELLRKTQLLAILALGTYPIVMTVLNSLAPELLGWGWLFPAAYVVLALGAMQVRGSLRLTAGLGVSALLLAAALLLSPAQCRLGAGAAALICCVLLLWSMQMGGWPPKQEIPMFWISYGILGHLVGQLSLRVDRVSGELALAPYEGLFLAALLGFALLTLFSMNRGSLMAASGKRQSVPDAMRQKNTLLILGMFIVAVLASLLPSALSALTGVIEQGIAWLVDFLSGLIPETTPNVVEDITSAAQTGALGGGGDGGTMVLDPLVEKMMAFCGAVLTFVFLGFLLYKMYCILRGKLRELMAALSKFADSVSEDYIDEVTDTREDITGEKLSKKDRPARPPLREPKGLSPAEKIRFRYRRLVLKHPEWSLGSTARETLPAEAASVYERARYSGHPVTEAEAEAFLKK